MSRLPLIGVTACSKQVGLHGYHISGDKYVRAVASAAKGLPLIIPSLAELFEPSDILDSVDGLLFTGSLSHVEPHLYGGPASEPGTAHDSARNRTTVPLIRVAVTAELTVNPVPGLVEAVSVVGGKAFASRGQWHPEWQVRSNPAYLGIFQAFGEVCRKRAKQRDSDALSNT